MMEEEPLEDGEILVITNASEEYSHYSQCFSSKHTANLLENKSRNHQIPLYDPNIKIPIGAIYTTTWEKDKGL